MTHSASNFTSNSPSASLATLDHVHQFIWQENLAFANIAQQALIDNFIHQMQQCLNALAGQKASLAMLPSLFMPLNKSLSICL